MARHKYYTRTSFGNLVHVHIEDPADKGTTICRKDTAIMKKAKSPGSNLRCSVCFPSVGHG